MISLDAKKIVEWSELFLTHPLGYKETEQIPRSPALKELRTKVKKFLRGEYVPEEVEEEE